MITQFFNLLLIQTLVRNVKKSNRIMWEILLLLWSKISVAKLKFFKQRFT